MRIYGPNGPAAPDAKPGVRRTPSGTFVLPGAANGGRPPSAAAPPGVSGIEALIALQGVDDPVERRRRAVSWGRSALDVLDELKLGLLAGTLDARLIARLKTASAAIKETTGDPALDGVLSEIELRVEVELAKMTQAGG